MKTIMAASLSAALILVTCFEVFSVQGDSMAPGFPDGSIVIVLRIAYGLQPPFVATYLVRWAYPAAGDVVVFIDPLLGRPALKRNQTHSNGLCWVYGDNPSVSVDSRHYGWIPVDAVTGRALFVLRRHA